MSVRVDLGDGNTRRDRRRRDLTEGDAGARIARTTQ